MVIENYEYVGFLAAFLTAAAFLPQVVKIIQTKSVKDISLGMYITYCIGLIVWSIYGFMIYAYPIIIANIVTFILAFIILYMKLCYK